MLFSPMPLLGLLLHGTVAVPKLKNACKWFRLKLHGLLAGIWLLTMGIGGVVVIVSIWLNRLFGQMVGRLE